ncbi:response regulator [Haloarchaeobius sp. HME9146]|uniref:response regulator n=1 Tax=Haloarchaeobius sp. HME9146 TaxID=2978732 RepID=UPI0021BEF149|nr:response regulator [Haloarchaeobius sp. HME9146]MCT9094833.1 response regulator [Haloarchaeobius sp. HME9146]
MSAEGDRGTGQPVSRSRRVHVLCVDDEPDLVELTSTFLEQESDRIVTTATTSVDDALDHLASAPVDCIVSDYQMPGQDGLTFLDAVRAEYGDLPFVLFTGKGSEEIASEAISRGVTDYLQKSQGADQYTVLANRVQNAVRGHRSEKRAENYLEATPDAIVIVDPDGRIRQVNERTESLFGYDRSTLVGERVELLIPERFRETYDTYHQEYVESPSRRVLGADYDLVGRRRDETEFPIDVTLSSMSVDGHVEVIVSVRDATVRHEHERALAELNRINRTIRETTSGVIAASTREEVEQSVCTTLAESEPYLFAWVGRVGDEREVLPTAWAGIEEGYLDSIIVTTDETPTGQGPGGRAARLHEPQAMQNVNEDPTFEPWREEAGKRGFESVASIPILHDDTCYGLVNVYADRPEAFDERELSVLADLGRTTGHAIHCLELADRLDRAGDAPEESPLR